MTPNPEDETGNSFNCLKTISGTIQAEIIILL